MKKRLFLLVTVFTPNLPEAAALTGFSEPASLSEMFQILEPLHEWGVSCVLHKGGHLPAEEQAIDLLSDGKRVFKFKADRFTTQNTHGTGCTLPLTVAAGLAKGISVDQSAREAKNISPLPLRRPIRL